MRPESQGEMFFAFAGMASLTPNSKLHIFVKTDKTLQKFLQGSYSIKLTKLCLKNRRDVLVSVPL